jgi:hypothetical protein
MGRLLDKKKQWRRVSSKHRRQWRRVGSRAAARKNLETVGSDSPSPAKKKHTGSRFYLGIF